MGLTIHYNLNSSTRSPKKARELVARLHGWALDLPFERVEDIIELSGSQCDYEQYGPDHPHRWLLIQAGAHIDDPKDKHYSYRVDAYAHHRLRQLGPAKAAKMPTSAFAAIQPTSRFKIG